MRIYDLVNGKDLGTLVQHEGSVTCLDMFMAETANRPSHLFSGGVDGLINVWRVKVGLDSVKKKRVVFHLSFCVGVGVGVGDSAVDSIFFFFISFLNFKTLLRTSRR